MRPARSGGNWRGGDWRIPATARRLRAGFVTRGGRAAGYSPQVARGVCDARRSRCLRRAKLAEGSKLHDWVRGKLLPQRGSPEQIAARLRLLHPDDPSQRVNPEAIHAAICAQPKGALKAAMVLALRQAKPARGLKRTTLAGSAMVPESLRIIHRPTEIAAHRDRSPPRTQPTEIAAHRDRSPPRSQPTEIAAHLIPGHWEGDLITGAFNRASVGTLVERKTRFVALCRMEGNTAAALEAFTRQMKHLPREMRRSMTCDRGSEMACHPELARRLKIDIRIGRPARAEAARQQRKHQRLAAPVHAQGHRAQRCLADLAERHRPADEPPPQKNPRLENPQLKNPRRSHGRRNQGLQFNRCT